VKQSLAVEEGFIACAEEGIETGAGSFAGAFEGHGEQRQSASALPRGASTPHGALAHRKPSAELLFPDDGKSPPRYDTSKCEGSDA
jgi:hypothetical protein